MQISVDIEELRPLVEDIVREVLAQLPREPRESRLAYTEPEAAALIGVARHVLRDARLRGEITGQLVGNKIVYSRGALENFISGRGAKI